MSIEAKSNDNGLAAEADPAQLTPVESNLAWAYDRVRNAILEGKLAPGSVVSQVQLAETVGVSRTPLREALRLLQNEGLVEAEHNKRIRVSTLSSEDLEQLYALRIVNEALAIRISVPLLTAADDERLASLLGEMADLQLRGDVTAWEKVHAEFHHELIRRAGSRCAKLIHELSAHATRYRRNLISQIPRAWSTGEAEHGAIVAAYTRRQPRDAAVLLARHLGRTALSLLAHDSPEREPAVVRAAIRSVTDPERG